MNDAGISTNAIADEAISGETTSGLAPVFTLPADEDVVIFFDSPDDVVIDPPVQNILIIPPTDVLIPTEASI
jgi:hypothetical protein